MKKVCAKFLDEFIHTKKPIHYHGKDTVALTDDLTAVWGVWEIRVKAGFETDGASIPRAAWRVVGHPFEEYMAAAVIHDVLYDSEHWPRDMIDECFKDLMSACGVGKIRKGIIYRAVRMFGGPTWWKHTDESKADARKHLSITYA